MRDTQWFADCKWGVFCHYLAGMASTPGQGVSAEAWNARVDAFDVKGLARQLESVHASYFFITLGQGSGHFCAPNETYDRLTGIQPSKCATRDLISDLYAELEPRGIRLMLYSASEMAWGDQEARPGLKMTHNHNDLGADGKKLGYQIWHQHRQVEFMRNVEAIHREWSERWGTKISGWWIDGCYEADARFPEDDPPNFATLAAALRAGNPDAIVCFNTGVNTRVTLNSKHEDYSAGEISRALPQVRSSTVELDGHHAQLHLLSFLGEFWGRGAPRFPDDLVSGYTRHVMENGGVMTWDVPILKNGLIPEPFLRQLSGIQGNPLPAD